MSHKLAAEFFGTFILALTVLLSSYGFYSIPTPVLAGIVLMLFVYSIGSVSGCHINPGVTLGILSIKKISPREALAYIAAQILGGFLAFLVVFTMGTTTTAVPTATLNQYAFEFIGMILFTFGVGAVVVGKVKDTVSGLLIGGSLFLGISLSVMGGAAGILNPAVGLSLQVYQIGYYLVQIIGGIVGFQLAVYLFSRAK